MDEKNNLTEYYKVSSPPEYFKGGDNIILRFDILPTINQTDLDKGFVYRYFSRQTNHVVGEIVEINESHYNNIITVPLYTSIRMIWRIRGELDDAYRGTLRVYVGVITSNTLAIEEGDKILSGLKLKLTNPLQFYQGV